MKKILLFILFIPFYDTSFAQNTFPPSGNVGIGTTSPLSPLDILGNSPTLYIRNTVPSTSVVKLVPYSDGTIYFETGSSTASDSRADLNFTSMNGSTDFITIQGSTGNLGIGTTTPAGKLTVSGVTNYNNVQFTGNSPTGVGMSLQNTQSGSHIFDLLSSGSEDAVGVGNFGIYDETASTYRFVIDASGNVLIGKTSQTNSSYKLDVNGNIRGNQITVNATGADYVFDSTCHLPSIDSLNNYIKEYHHLPGISSAKQMRDEGNNIGSTQMKMLQNEEEMALYIISMNKKVQVFESQLNRLASANKKLTTRISELYIQIRELKSKHK
ncbi:MAG: hypothetical protein EPN39_11550 [Chitinophagaceae bacterium]|nr:MAG: hypothetical protein EPN39_11550 [Chitinophagaceae bacterium]